jgi:hypothetical protein
MKKAIFLFAIAFSLSMNDQLNEVKEKLNEYQISSDLLTKNLKDADAEHYFNLKTTTVNGTDTKVEFSHFDPTQVIGSRWILDNINGNTPTTKELKTFDKTHNTKQPSINGKVKDDSWQIVRDDNTFLVISFSYDKASLPKKYKFLGDCKGLAYFNKKSKLLEKAEFLNMTPLTIKLLRVNHLDMVVNYTWSSAEEAYFISNEELNMSVEMLGQIVVVKELNEYSNYVKN